MHKVLQNRPSAIWVWAAFLAFAGIGIPQGLAEHWTPTALASPSVQSLPNAKAPPGSQPDGTTPTPESKASSASEPARITPEQAQQLFHSVDSILKFDSRTTGLPILHPVKRRLVTRDEVVQYLDHQLHHGRDAQRLERSELVLKKFGLLKRDFDLQPFLVKLLREQIAGYYDDKTNTVNLLDWVPPDEQKPVLAHELTHALQDQHIHLAKWDRQSDLSISKNVKQDNQHIATDEEDTARDAVVEGQAMAVFFDYMLAPMGKTLLSVPSGLADRLNDAMAKNSGSPVLAEAPLVLRKSLLFPYADGLAFVRAVLVAKGKQAGFAGMLDHPPSSTYQIMTPQVYLDNAPVPRLHMPDIHPLIRKQYKPYDVGVIGEFDVQVIAQQFSGPEAAKALAPAWRGGIYYAAQSRSAKTKAERNSPDSLALLYLSHWATPEAAQSFAELFAKEIPREYAGASLQKESNGDSESEPSSGSRHVWQTAEGPVVIVNSGKAVFVSESFPLPLAGKLESMMIASVADGSGQVAPSIPPGRELTAGLRSAFGLYGCLYRVEPGCPMFATGRELTWVVSPTRWKSRSALELRRPDLGSNARVNRQDILSDSEAAEPTESSSSRWKEHPPTHGSCGNRHHRRQWFVSHARRHQRS